MEHTFLLKPISIALNKIQGNMYFYYYWVGKVMHSLGHLLSKQTVLASLETL